MEYVGKMLKKEFQGYGVFSGIVNSYDPSSGFFEIVYEDGDSEELEMSEVALLLEEKATVVEPGTEAELIEKKPRLGRRPKKRRRVETKTGIHSDSGNACGDNLSKDGIGHEGFSGTLEEKLANCPNDGLNSETLEHKVGNCSNDGLKLNHGLNSINGLNLNDAFNPNDGSNLDVNLFENVKKRDCIDLNLNVNDDFDENLKVIDLVGSGAETRKRECCFDLNLGFDDESKDTEGVCGGQLMDNTAVQMIEESQKEISGVAEEKLCMEDGSANGIVKGSCFENVHGNSVKGISGSNENVSEDTQLGSSVKEIRKEEASVSSEELRGHASLGVMDANYAEDSRSLEVQLKEGLSEPSTTVNNEYQDGSGSSYKRGTSGKKRRKVSGNLKPTTEPVLRRSTRRGSATYSAHDHVLSEIAAHAVNDVLSPVVSAVLEGKPDISGSEGPEELSVPPPKLQLPPSSQNLNLDGIPMLDFFSVYSCLRSFSTLLFLSPFELEDFVAALKCKSPSPLFDFIHVSILQTLRKHLEFLSDEGSQSASDCLRCLNWGLLDLITWPIFMVEYLLIHGSGLKPDFNFSRLKLFESEYYRQPVSVKVEILRCLCDDVIEVEAIRSELNRRSLAAVPDRDFDRNVNMEMCKKRRTVMDVSGGSCLTEEVVEETTDWNSDECCLCKMDGSLICCDGCPAAYHSRCVGVATDLLPEGEWYCPECVIEKHNPWMKPRKSLRGAELLGIDPDDRLYFSSCGYLLVSDSCDTEYSINYYHRNDLNAVIDVLKASDIRYGGILNAISKNWDIPINFSGANSNLDSQNHAVCSDIMKGQIPVVCIPPLPLAPSETCTVMDETVDQRKAEENSNIAEYSGHLGHVVAKSGNLLDSATVNHFMKMENPITSSEGSAEITEVSAGIQNCQKHGSDGLNRSDRILNQSEISGKTALGGDSSLTSSTSDVKREKNLELAFSGRPSARNTRKGDSLQVECGTAYMNYYGLAQTASSIAEELLRKSSDKINEESARSVEEIISTQLKAISKKSTKFCWPNILNLNLDAWKEKCGWCFYCKAPDDNTDCLFKMDDAGPVQEGSKSEVVGLRSKRNRKGHLIDVICHILCIEDRLRGLLLGPWLNPHHSKYWRKVVLKATDVASVRHPLLTFESNLRQLALSADWLKHVDSVVRMGSASHVVTSFVHVSSKHGISKKRGRGVDYGPTPSSNAASGLSMFWWRGGRISRHVFNWKVLPRSLARKAARQAGCTKIPGISYLESSEFAKRSKYAAWRAAVQTSTSVEQLALLVRELHSNIRWDDIENTHSPSKMDKEFKKSIRPFKKVIIRRKCIEGTVVKYLLDFGKRKIIPDIVVRHGSMLEESSSGRKKYWLEESHVPLHLLKSFEEKRIARKASKMNSGKLPERSRVKKRPSKKSGFSYLFSKAEKSENYQCGHCNKDVLIRDAVSCQYCEGFFHKRHVRKSAGAITAECTYTCHKCQDGKRVRIDTERKKVQSQKGKKAITDTRPSRSKNSKKARTDRRLVRSQNNKKVSADVPLRRSARKVKHVVLQNKKLGARKKGKKIKSRKGTSRKPKKYTSWQKKRTWVYRTYWLNGLLLSKKPDDERVMHFRKKKFLPSGDLTVIHDRPKCRLCCEAEYTSTLHYVSCEICGDWFHGDAFGLNAEKIGNLIGFRCHACRKRTPPVCPHLQNMRGDVAQLGEATNNAEVEYFEEVSNAVPPPSEVYVEQKSHLDQDLFPIDESINEEEQLDMVLDPNQSILLESKLEADNGHICTGKKQETDAKNSCGEDLRPDVLTGSDQNFMLEESTIISGKGHIDAVTSLVEAEPLSCKSDVDLIDTELAPLEHSEENDGLVDTTIILKSPVDKTLVNSSELHPQTLVGSGEL